MKQLLATAILVLAFCSVAKAQVNYSGRIETGYMIFIRNSVLVKAEPGWKGYFLDDNGFEINSINGLTFANGKTFVGIGLGYLNFEGINGVSVFANLEYLSLKTKISPLFYFNLGYDHIWNQYDGGTGTILAEIGVGVSCNLAEKLGFYLKQGFLLTQQSFLIPITIGLRF